MNLLMDDDDDAENVPAHTLLIACLNYVPVH